MKKRILSIVLCAAMVMALAAGCGKKEEAKTETTEVKREQAKSDDAGTVEENKGTEPYVNTPAKNAEEFAKQIKDSVPEGDYSKLTIGFCGMTLNNEYHIILANAVKTACENLGLKVEIQAGAEHASVDEQLTIIENFISQGVNGIILVPAASQGLISALQDCKDAGIPVINLDTQLDKTTLSTLGEEIPFYGTDNYVGGQMVGEFFKEMYPDGGKVAILRGVQGQTNDEDRYKGFLNTAGNIDLVFEQHANWETDQAYTAIQNCLTSNKDLAAIYCENDLMGIGAYQAIDEAGLADKVKIFSYDGISEGIQYVIDGKFVSTCAQQPIEMGKLGVINMAKVLMGEKAETYIDTGCNMVTSDNAKETMDNVKLYTKAIEASK